MFGLAGIRALLETRALISSRGVDRLVESHGKCMKCGRGAKDAWTGKSGLLFRDPQAAGNEVCSGPFEGQPRHLG